MKYGLKITSLVVLSMVVVFAIPVTVAAQRSNSIGANPRKDFVINPGESRQDTIAIRNLDQTKPLIVSIDVIDFESSGQTGAPKLLINRTNPTRWSLKPFLKIQKSVTIAPGSLENVPVTVTLPKDQGAGSYYSAIQYSTGNTDADKGNVGLSGTTATLVFVRASGEANNSLLLKKFGAFVPNSDFSNGQYQRVYGSTKPKHLSYELENKGNVADEPRGSIEIKNIFGNQFKIIPNINPNNNLVLIGQTRRIDICIDPPSSANESNSPESIMDITKCDEPSLWPGRYTAKIDLLYGDNGSASREIVASSSFWYLPAWFVIVFAVLIAFLAGLIWSVIRKIKNFKKPTYGSRRR